MNSFGLGLVLNFVDNASSGMNSATQTFMRMSATADGMVSSVGASAAEMASIAFSLSAVGDTFMSIGESITGVFTGITQKVIDTGTAMQGYRLQLAALYGSTEAGETKIEEIKQYAMSSVFAIESLIPAVTMMKAVGIEAMQEVTTSSGSATQKLLDYASDIAAMVPNMRNTYGTGVQAAMGALKEYIAEGNALSLKRGAGLDITGILGESKGSTIEERTQQIADLVDKLNIVGYTANLAGTPTQRLSNMQDALFNSLSKIADSGVFEAYCSLLERLSDWVFTLVEDEEKFNLITGILADTVTTLLTPLSSLLDWLVEFSDVALAWMKEHPKLTKNILLSVAALGAFLVAGGGFLKLLSSIAFAMNGLTMLKALPSLLFKVATGFVSLIGKALPFVALAALAYFVWKNNMFGIRDVVTKVCNDLGTIFSILGDAWDDNTLSEDNFVKAKELGILPFIEALLQLKYYWDFFIDGFKTGFKSFFEGIVKSLEWLKIAGVDVNGLVASFGEFLKSLTEVGAEDKWRAVGEAAGKIAGALLMLIVLINVVQPVITIISGIGKAFMGVTKIARGLWSVLKFLFNPLIKAVPFVMGFFSDMGAAISLMKEGFGFFEVMGAWFPKVAAFFTKIGGFFTKIGSAIAGVGSKIAGLFTSGAAMASFFSGVALAIIGVFTYVKNLIDMFKNGENASNILKASIGGLTGALGAFLMALGVGATVATGGIAALVVGIVAAIGILVALIVNHWEEISNFFTNTLPQWLSSVVTAIGTFFSNVWGAITGWFSKITAKVKEVIMGVVNAILSNPIVQSVIKVMSSIFACISTVVKIIVAIIVGVAKTIWGVIKLIATVVAGVAKVIWAIVSGVVKTIWTIIKGIAKVISSIVMGIWSVIKKVAELIWTIIKTAFNIITAIVRTFYNFFRMIFYAVLLVAKTIINAIGGFFSWLWGKIQPILQAIGDFFSIIFNWVWTNVISPVVNWIVQAFTNVKDWIIGVLQAIGDFFASIFNWINTNVLTPFYDFVVSVFDWISEKVTIVTDWISSAFTTAVDAIKDVFGSISDFFSGVFGKISDIATGFFDWIGGKLSWVTDTLRAIGDFFGGAINKAGDWFAGIGDKLKNLVGLDTGGYVKTTGIAVLHPNEVVVNDDTTQRLQNFLGQFEGSQSTGVVPENSPTKAVMNNIYPTVMESVPVSTVPAKVTSTEVVNNNSYLTSAPTQNITQKTTDTTQSEGDTKYDYSVTFAAGSVVIQLLNATEAELEKAADKLMKIIARKQKLQAMATRV